MVIIPPQVASRRQWVHCIIAKVISDRMVIDNQFYTSMARVWVVGEEGAITLLGRNTYLVKLEFEEEMWRVVDKGI
jgi:hypothetical protein